MQVLSSSPSQEPSASKPSLALHFRLIPRNPFLDIFTISIHQVTSCLESTSSTHYIENYFICIVDFCLTNQIVSISSLSIMFILRSFKLPCQLIIMKTHFHNSWFRLASFMSETIPYCNHLYIIFYSIYIHACQFINFETQFWTLHNMNRLHMVDKLNSIKPCPFFSSYRMLVIFIN